MAITKDEYWRSFKGDSWKNSADVNCFILQINRSSPVLDCDNNEIQYKRHSCNAQKDCRTCEKRHIKHYKTDDSKYYNDKS